MTIVLCTMHMEHYTIQELGQAMNIKKLGITRKGEREKIEEDRKKRQRAKKREREIGKSDKKNERAQRA